MSEGRTVPLAPLRDGDATGWVLVSLATLLFGMLPITGPHPSARWLGLGLALGVVTLAWRRHHAGALAAAALTALTAASWWMPWPLGLAVPLVVFGLLAWRSATLRRGVPPLTLGNTGWAVRFRVLGITLVSSTALVLWVIVLRPDLRDLTRLLPDLPLGWLLLGGLAFALLNALLEEAAYRFLFQGALESAGSSAGLAIVIQGVAFGLMHWHGFPRGAVGVGLATLYGLLLGELRYRAGGMLAPYTAHVVADLTIFALLLWLA